MILREKLRSVLSLSPHQRERLAAALEVSASTIDRWASGAATPQPKHADALSELLIEYGDTVEKSRIIRELGKALSAAREVMHRHGAASSRNDALDQVSLLLSVHLHLRRSNKAGLQNTEKTELGDSLIAAVEELQARAPEEVHERFSISAKMLARKPSYLTELVDSLSPALEEIDASEDWQRPHEFHEIFVNFLATSFHEEKEFAQYMTPREVVDFMARVGASLLDASVSRPRVLDPSCGTASFLASFAEFFMQHLKLRSGQGADEKWRDEAAPEDLVGIDTSERMVRLATTSLVTADIEPRSIFLDSSLDPKTLAVARRLNANIADLILTNPPFGAEHSKGSHGGGKVPSEVLYIQRYVEWLRPGGIALTIVPDSVLTNKGLFAAARAKLLELAEVLAVVSLPPVTFAASGTTTKTSILVIKKKDGKPGKKAFFAVANSVGFSVSTRGSIRKRVMNDRNDLPAIADALIFDTDTENVGVHKIVDETLERWDAQFITSQLGSEEKAGSQGGERVRISDVAELVKDKANPAKAGSPTFSYIEISNVDGSILRVSANETVSSDAPSRARRRVQSGDVLISTVRPERRTVGVVPPHLDGAICSTGFAVLRASTISPYVLAAALRSQRTTAKLIGVSAGVAYPAFDPEALPSIEIELGSKAWQDKCSAFGRALEELDSLREEVLAA